MFPPIGGADKTPPEGSAAEERTETPAEERTEQQPEDMVRTGLQSLASAGHKWASPLLTRFNGLWKIEGTKSAGGPSGAPQAPGATIPPALS